MWDNIVVLIQSLGVTKGLFAVFFIGAHLVIYGLYRNTIKQMQAEINRLAAENREYRERFLSFVDKHMNYKKPKATKKKGEK